MASAHAELLLGPFPGGLNNVAATPDTIADNELAVCLEFDYNVDGTLQTRPPVAREVVTTEPGADGFYPNILGFFVDTNGDIYCLATISTNLYYRMGNSTLISATDWTVIPGGIGNAEAGLQYVNKFYILYGGGGYSWSPSLGLASVPTMPGGKSIQLFKERLWISGLDSSRLYYSNVGTGDTWSGSDFVDVDAGNGQKLTSLYAGQSALYLFKTNSIYVLTYDSIPARGLIQNISTNIGLADRDCFTSYEGSIYILYGADLYRLSGYEFTRVNPKIDLTLLADPSLSYKRKTSISTVSDRIVVQYKNNTFVYYPITNTWTQWTLRSASKWFYVPNTLQDFGYKVFLSPQNFDFTAGLGTVYVIKDKDTSGPLVENNTSTPKLVTKQFTFQTPAVFKRMYWWGVEANIRSRVADSILRLTPYFNGNSGIVNGIGILASNAFSRRFIKAGVSARFTKVQFEIYLQEYDFSAVSSFSSITVCTSQKQDPTPKTLGG